MGAKDLWASERGVFAIALVVLVTLLLAIGRVTAEQWISYTQWIAVALIAGKTVSHAVEARRWQQQPNNAPPTVPPASVVSGGSGGADTPKGWRTP
jgi:hypothetical protein